VDKKLNQGNYSAFSAYFNLAAKSRRVLTKKDLMNIIARKATSGDISMPNLKLGGRNLLIGTSTGSVYLSKNCTIGL